MATDDDHDTIRRQFGEAVFAQEPATEDVETSRWRYSLMDWGHDPLKSRQSPR